MIEKEFTVQKTKSERALEAVRNHVKEHSSEPEPEWAIGLREAARKGKVERIHSLIASLYVGNKQDFLNSYSRLNDFHNERCGGSGTTGKPDCLFLYLLAMEFKPKCAFEAGTYVGTSAKFIAEGCMPHGGTVYTCDPRDHYRYSEEHDECIKRHTMGAIGLVDVLRKKNEKIDLAFIDTRLPKRQLNDVLSICTDEAVLAFHDFYDTEGNICKGAENIYNAWCELEPKGYKIFLPDFSSYFHGHNVSLSGGARIFTGICGCSAALVPPSYELKDN